MLYDIGFTITIAGTCGLVYSIFAQSQNAIIISQAITIAGLVLENISNNKNR